MNHSHAPTRRRFLQWAGLSAAVSLSGAGGSAVAAAETATDRTDRPLKLGLASYTFRKFDLDQALAMTGRVGLTAICLKSFHLPLDATPEQIAAAVEKIKQAGILLYGGGVIQMNNEQQVDQAFEYARAAGMAKIVGVPAPDQLSRVNEKVQQYDIEVCIHNHGPGDQIYPTPDVAYEKIRELDKRIGLCHDIGHTLRYGKDPVAVTQQCADRLLDVHIKDVTEASQQGQATPCGRGVIDLPAMLRLLLTIDYQGYVSFEYEEHPDDPLPGLAESVGYIHGVLDAL